MKVVGVLFITGVLLVLVSTAFAGSTSNPTQKQLSALQSQIRALKYEVRKLETLQAQVRTLKAQVKTLTRQQSATETDMLGNYQGDACSAAVTADALQGTWSAINDLAKKTNQAPYFGSQSPIDDHNTCLVGITRQPGVATVDPLQSAATWAAG